MAVAWPGSLPQTPLFGWTKQLAETRLRTQTDTGPAKVRRQFTSGVENLSNVSILVTEAQRTTFQTFFDDTTSGGSLPFEWQMPDTGATRDFRFKETPVISAVNHQTYRITMNLEALPAPVP